MEVEAALPPPIVRLNNTTRKYALRVLRLPSEHFISKAFKSRSSLSLDFPSSPARFKEPRTTQLNRIKNSISELVDSSLLEPIKHFYFPPWNKTPPYSVKISELPKEEAALAHTSSLKSFGKNDVLIYSDASVFPKKTTSIRTSLIVLKYNTTNKSFGKTHQESTNIGPSQLVYNSELEGITKGIKYASSRAKLGQYFHIYSNNKTVIYKLQDPSDKPDQSHQIRAYKATKSIKD